MNFSKTFFLLLLFALGTFSFNSISEQYTLLIIKKEASEKYYETLDLLEENWKKFESKNLSRKEFMISSKKKIQEFKESFIKMRIKRTYFKNLVTVLRDKLNLARNWKPQYQPNKNKNPLEEKVIEQLKKNQNNEIHLEPPKYQGFFYFVVISLVIFIGFNCFFWDKLACGISYGLCACTGCCCFGISNGFIFCTMLGIISLIFIC